MLVGHSGGGALVGEVVDKRPDRVRRAIYVDTGPLEDGAAIDAAADQEVEVPLPHVGGVRRPGVQLGPRRRPARGVPPTRGAAPGGRCVRGPVHVGNPARFDVPATAICTSLSSEQLKPMAHGGPPFHTELGSALDLTYVDLPTGHWPMFSRPDDLAGAIVRAARA